MQSVKYLVKKGMKKEDRESRAREGGGGYTVVAHRKVAIVKFYSKFANQIQMNFLIDRY